MENDVDTLGNEVYLSNKVISTIHELEPNLEVLENSNGIVTLNMEMRSSGDLQIGSRCIIKKLQLCPQMTFVFIDFNLSQ